MFVYIIRRLVLAIPTFLGITLVTFLIINSAPGGPIEQKLQKIRMGSGENVGEAQAFRKKYLMLYQNNTASISLFTNVILSG